MPPIISGFALITDAKGNNNNMSTSTLKLVLAGQVYQLFIDSCRSPKTKQTYEASLRSYTIFRKVSSVEPLLVEDIKQAQSKASSLSMSKGEKQPFVADMCNQGSYAQTLLRNERHNAQLEEDQPFHWREGKDDTGQGLHKRGDQEDARQFEQNARFFHGRGKNDKAREKKKK